MTTENEQKPAERAIEPVADTAAPENYEANDAARGGADDTGADERAPTPRFRSAVDREEIAERFAQRRRDAEEQIGFTGSHADLTTLAGRLTQEQSDEPEPEPGPDATAQHTDPEARESGPSDSETQPQPQAKKKLVVRREEREVDDDELVRLAQIGAAGESYLQEAKALRDEAEALRKASVPRPHPDAETTAREPNETSTRPDPSHPMDAKALAEKLQFGSPDDAAEVIETLRRGSNTEEAVRKVLIEDRIREDVSKATTEYQAFVKDNEALVKDPIAHAAMEKVFYDGLREDLRKAGITDDRIPTANERLVDAHRILRIHGQPVRNTTALLEASKQAVLSWKGGSPTPQPAPKPGDIRVTVDRTERRSAITPQPARAAAPPPTITPQKPVQTVRSQAVSEMMGKRRRLVVT